MSDRTEELAMRRRRLQLRSEQLRAELAADQQGMRHALRGVDRAISAARKAAKPVFLVGAGLLLFKLLRGRRAPRVAAPRLSARRGLMMRALFVLSVARRALPYVSLARNLWRSRSSPRTAPYRDPSEAEQAR
jgi:hypothetical protein